MAPTSLVVSLAVGAAVCSGASFLIATVVGAAVYSLASFFSSPEGKEPTITLESSPERSESSITERRQPPSKRWYEGDIHGPWKHENGISFGSLDQSSSSERSENLIIEWQPPPSTGRYDGKTDGSYKLEKEESDTTERLEGLITDGSYKEEQKILAIPDHQSSTERLDRTIVEWKRPKEGWHKVNTNCSFKHKDKMASHFSSSSSGREEPKAILQSSAERSSAQWRTNGSFKREEVSSDFIKLFIERLEELIIKRLEESIIERLEESINEWQPPVNRSCDDGNADGSCKHEKKTLSIPESSTAKRLERSISQWQQPPEGWHKVNTDCSCKPNMKKSGVGGLIRDHSGEWKLGFVARIEWKKGKATDRAELWGIYYGLKVAWEGGFRRIVLESDNKSVVEKVQMIMNAPNCDDPLLMEVKKLRQRKWKTKVVFIPREGNACADFMAEIAITKKIGLQILKKPPRNCRRWIHHLLSEDL